MAFVTCRRWLIKHFFFHLRGVHTGWHQRYCFLEMYFTFMPQCSTINCSILMSGVDVWNHSEDEKRKIITKIGQICYILTLTRYIVFCEGCAKQRWLWFRCGYMEPWLYSFRDGYRKTTMESIWRSKFSWLAKWFLHLHGQSKLYHIHNIPNGVFLM